MIAQPRTTRSDRCEKAMRKRSRCRSSTSSSFPGMLVVVATAITLIIYPVVVDSFTSSPLLSYVRESSVMLRVSRSSTTTEFARPVKPRTSISDEKREKAIKAMKRRKVESALDGVDAQMLELLSEGFLYPPRVSSSAPANASKKKGRPDYVPGAMNYETLQRFRERQEIMDLVSDNLVSEKELSAIVASLSASQAAAASKSEAKTNSAPAPTISIPENSDDNVVVKKKVKKVKGSVYSDAPKELPESSSPTIKQRKRVVKNLPEPRDRSKGEENTYYSPKGRKPAKGKHRPNNLELQKYYRTELLTQDEEYTLSMKIQFMINCEHVHEGLATHLMRLPTIEEWANACGFEQEDPDFVTMLGDDQIRPVGSDTMFELLDPKMFVGNGLAQNTGPGRGRGRAKKPPPMKLKDFYDDSEERAADRLEQKTGDKNPNKPKKELVNRGTPKDFVEMMMTSKEAKQRMVQCNMRLVVSIARKYSNVGVSVQDLVQEGSLGLSRATEKFDPSKGFKFSTYASWWIQQAVFRSIAYHSRTIRLPVHVHNLLNRVRKIRNNLERTIGRQPSNEEMAEELDMSLEKYNKMLRMTKRSISLEMPKYQSNPKDLGHASVDLLGDSIESTGDLLDDATPEKRVDRGLFRDDLKEMLKILDDDERKVICSRYGLDDGLTRTVTAVAAQMKQSKAWVRSQECRALRKLRRPWYEKKLKEHQDALVM